MGSPALRWLKKEPLVGKFIVMEPVDRMLSQYVIEIRNTPRAMEIFNQSVPLTRESQDKWMDAYEQREGDIQWCAFTAKDHTFIGCTRLYDIDEDKGTAESGSTIVFEDRAAGAPYALEMMYLPIRYSFNELKLKAVVTHTRADNARVLAINETMGIDPPVRHVMLNGLETVEAYFTPSGLRIEMIEKQLHYWSQRLNHPYNK